MVQVTILNFWLDIGSDVEILKRMSVDNSFSTKLTSPPNKGADMRHRGTCGTFQPINLTYHERTTFIDIYVCSGLVRARTIEIYKAIYRAMHVPT